jgi:hypothetical protein
MGEMIQHFYEAEIEWTGDKDLKLSGGKLPTVAAGAPPNSKGGRETGRPSIFSSPR